MWWTERIALGLPHTDGSCGFLVFYYHLWHKLVLTLIEFCIDIFSHICSICIGSYFFPFLLIEVKRYSLHIYIINVVFLGLEVNRYNLVYLPKFSDFFFYLFHLYHVNLFNTHKILMELPLILTMHSMELMVAMLQRVFDNKAWNQ